MWKEYYIFTAPFSNLTALTTGATFTDLAVRIDSDADFEFIKTIFYPVTTRVRVQYRDDSIGRFLMKGSMDLRTIGGTALYTMAPGPQIAPGFLPYIWPVPYVISAATLFTVSAADYSGLGGSPYINFHGSKLRKGDAPWKAKKWKAKIPYTYPINDSNPPVVSVPANGIVSQAIPTDIDSHFIVHKITGNRTGNCLITIKDGARDRQWMDTAIPFDNLVGNGQFPNILPSFRFIPRGAVIVVTIQDLSGAANQVEINFTGVKLYE